MRICSLPYLFQAGIPLCTPALLAAQSGQCLRSPREQHKYLSCRCTPPGKKQKKIEIKRWSLLHQSKWMLKGDKKKVKLKCWGWFLGYIADLQGFILFDLAAVNCLLGKMKMMLNNKRMNSLKTVVTLS